jgi:hypothetical protein
MKINDIVTESTTAGSIATVAAPMTTQSRNASIYGGKKGGNLLTGKKTNKKYANSVNESKMKELAMDIRNMDNGNFKKKYGNTKEHFKATLGDPDKKTVSEAQLEEDDVIIVPGQGRSRKTGFIKHGESRLDHEVEMARSDLFQAAKNAKQVYEMIADVSEEEGLEGWVQEKIIKANDYLNSVREYLEGKQLQEITGGVIAGGGVGESEQPKMQGDDYDLLARLIEHVSGDVWRVVVANKNYSHQYPVRVGKKFMYDELVSNGYTKAAEQWKKFIQSEPEEGRYWLAKNDSGKFHFTRKDPKSSVKEGKGLWANIHAKRERIKKGSGERMRKPGSKGAPSSQDFKDAAKEGRFNEAQSMGTALKNTLAKAEPGSKLDNSIKAHNRDIKNGGKGTLKNAPTGYHFDKKGYCRLGDK